MDVELPNGTVIEGVPDNYTKDQVKALALRNKLASPQDFGLATSATVGQIPTGGEAPSPTVGERAVAPTYLEAAIEGAMTVPMLAGAARGLQMLTRGSKAAPYAAEAARALIPTTGKRLVAEGLIGAAAGVGGKVGTELAPTEYGTAGEITGGTVGGMLGGLGVNAVRNAYTGAKGLLNIAGGAKGTADELAAVAGGKRASRQAATALAANPDLANEIKRSADIEELTGVKLPILPATGGDTTIKGMLQSQIARAENAPFTAELSQQYKQAEEDLRKATGRLAVNPLEVMALVKRRASQTQEQNIADLAKFNAKQAKRQADSTRLTDRIVEVSSKLAPSMGPEELGSTISNLVEANKAVVTKELSPQYTKLLQEYTDKGVVMPAEVASEVRGFALDQDNADIFKTFPSLYGKIKNMFGVAERRVSKTPTPFEQKYKNFIQTQPTKQIDVSLQDVDSLKRELAASIRKADPTQQRVLIELQNQLEAAIAKTDPEFASAYQNLDAEWYKRVGLPFNSKGAVDIDRAKFVEYSVPVLTKNTSSLKQAMAVIGNKPEGMQIIEDAFLMDISNSRGLINTQTGELNVKAFNRYLKQKDEQLSLVPGLKDKLQSIANKAEYLSDARARVLDNAKQAKFDHLETLYTKANGTAGGFEGLVQKSLTTPAALDELIAVAGKDKMAKEAIKSTMLDSVLRSPGDKMELLTQSEGAFKKVFGTEHWDNIKAIIEAAKRLQENPLKVSLNVGTIPKSKFEQVTSSKPEQVAGELRNQIITVERAAMNFISRYFQGSASKNEAAEVQKFLLDPSQIKQTADLMKELEKNGRSLKAAALLKKMAGNTLSSLVYGGTVGAAIGAQGNDKQAPAQIDPALLEGFGQ
jgi:hypothetical protein